MMARATGPMVIWILATQVGDRIDQTVVHITLPTYTHIYFYDQGKGPMGGP